jgi:glycosyltransferase involved in cell wall biosynthesis
MPKKHHFNDINEKVRSKGITFISVIVPTYNDPSGIKDTLDSLINQDYGADNFEIIVVDNGSVDNTQAVINDYSERHPRLIRLVVEDKIQSSYAARNKGIESAKGSIIAFIDADMSVGKDWLTNIERSLKKYRCDYLACGVEIYFKNKSIYEIYDKITGFPLDLYMYEYHFAPTCCLVVRKEVFKEVGSFDSRLISSGDLEFGMRVHEKQLKLFFDPNISMKHPARSSLRKLCNKYFRIGRGHLQLSVYYPDRFSKMFRYYRDPLFYLPKLRKSPELKDGNDIWHELSFENKIKINFIKWILTMVEGAGYFYENYKD